MLSLLVDDSLATSSVVYYCPLCFLTLSSRLSALPEQGNFNSIVVDAWLLSTDLQA